MEMSNSIPIFFFVIVTVSISIYLYNVMTTVPIMDLAITDIGWTREWLYMAVLDYYGAALSLSAIAMASEGWIAGSLWSLGFLFLGGPVCTAYIVYRLWTKGVALADTDLEVPEGRGEEEGLSMLGNGKRQFRI